MSPLSVIGFPAHDIAMMISIALRFIPTFAEETERIMRAQASRGADFDSKNYGKKYAVSYLYWCHCLLVPLEELQIWQLQWKQDATEVERIVQGTECCNFQRQILY